MPWALWLGGGGAAGLLGGVGGLLPAWPPRPPAPTSKNAGGEAPRATKNLFSGPNCDTAILPAGCIGQAHEKGSESPRRGPSRGCAGTGDAHLDALGHRPSDELAQAPEDVGCQVAQLRGPRRVLGGND